MDKKVLPTSSEKSIQKQVVKFVSYQYPSLFFLSIRNEGKRSLREGKEAKDMGLRPGASDLYFLHNGKSLFLELKTKVGKQSDKQKSFESDITQNGGLYKIAYSFEEAKLHIENFLKNI